MSRGELTEQVRSALDIVEVVAEHVALRRAGKDYKGLCPFHQEKTPSFFVIPAKGSFYCFGCGAGGDIFKFIQLRENVSFVEARAILAERAGIPLDLPPGAADQQRSLAELARLNRLVSQWFTRNLSETAAGKAAGAYARSRGFSEETISRFALGYAPDSWDGLVQWARGMGLAPAGLAELGLIKLRDQRQGYYDAFRHRLMFPIVGTMERVVGFGGRALPDGKCAGQEPAKYLNSPESPLFDKRRTLFGLAAGRAAIEQTARAVVVEGYTDCIMAHQQGFQETVATLGTAFSEEHASLVGRFTDRIVLMFDADQAGQAAAQRALHISLAKQLDVRLAQVPQGQDPCDYLCQAGAEAFARLVDQAADALDYHWRQVERKYQSDESPRARRRAVEEFIALLAETAQFDPADARSAIERKIILDRAARLLGMPNNELERLFQQYRRRMRATTRARSRSENRPAAVLEPAVSHQTALREILEVSLNEPGYLQQAGALFDSQWFEDERLRRIGGLAQGLADSVGEFSLAELLSRIEDTQQAQLAVALQMAGQRRGNYAATVNGALGCLRMWRQQQESHPQQGLATSADEDARLRQAEQRGRANRHFNPLRSRGTLPSDLASGRPPA